MGRLLQLISEANLSRSSSKLILGLFLECRCSLYHFLYSTLQLAILAAEIVFRTVVYNDVWLKQRVLAIVAAHVYASHLWYAESNTVDECFPPYTGSSARYGRSDKLAKFQVLVFAGESAGITVVIFTDKHT